MVIQIGRIYGTPTSVHMNSMRWKSYRECHTAGLPNTELGTSHVSELDSRSTTRTGRNNESCRSKSMDPLLA